MIMRRLLALAVTVALSTVVLLVSAAPQATASEGTCEAVALPRLANMGRFRGLPDELTPDILVDVVFGGDVEEALDELAGIATNPGVAPEVQAFFGDVVVYLLNPGEECGPSLTYGGPFASAPAAPTAVFGFDSIKPVPASPGLSTPDNTGVFSDPGSASAPSAAPAPAPVASAEAPSTELAVTGTESEVLVYFGAGFVGFGALALAARRRLD